MNGEYEGTQACASGRTSTPTPSCTLLHSQPHPREAPHVHVRCHKPVAESVVGWGFKKILHGPCPWGAPPPSHVSPPRRNLSARPADPHFGTRQRNHRHSLPPTDRPTVCMCSTSMLEQATGKSLPTMMDEIGNLKGSSSDSTPHRPKVLCGSHTTIRYQTLNLACTTLPY